jgi:hypothetical protein
MSSRTSGKLDVSHWLDGGRKIFPKNDFARRSARVAGAPPFASLPSLLERIGDYRICCE